MSEKMRQNEINELDKRILPCSLKDYIDARNAIDDKYSAKQRLVNQPVPEEAARLFGKKDV